MLTNKLTGAGAADKTYIEDVFSTYLYTGNGSTQTINNGIDLAGKGGMVWIKNRNSTEVNALFDTARTGRLSSDLTNTQSAGWVPTYFNFNSSGFYVDAAAGASINTSNNTYASWTFRKAPKFFDVVTYTGNGTSYRSIAHNLGSAPGMVIIKRVDSTGNWAVWHRSAPSVSSYLFLNTTADAVTNAQVFWIPGDQSSFYIGNSTEVNASGGTYVAYLFAHETTTDGLIQCGSFTTDASGNATVNLGWEPQYVMFKSSGVVQNWFVADNMRGASETTYSTLSPNTTMVENTSAGANLATPFASGFKFTGSPLTPSATYIYMAIRRGPMRTPTDGTKVFDPRPRYGNNSQVNVGFPVDLQIFRDRFGTVNTYVLDRLRGVSTNTTSSGSYLYSNTTNAEATGSISLAWDNIGYTLPTLFNGVNLMYWNFRRAPGFFDVVCYTGTGAVRTVNHNLGVAPELIIIKGRDYAGSWIVYASPIGNTKIIVINSTNEASTDNNVFWNSTSPTSTNFTLGNYTQTNGSPYNYVAYLFASCPGVSKVGNYTGNGSSQTINCGFTNGARFFLVKATSTTGNWWVYDTTRGVVAAADPTLALNTTAAEVTSADAVDPDSTGIIVNQEATCSINANGVSYIYLAIA